MSPLCTVTVDSRNGRQPAVPVVMIGNGVRWLITPSIVPASPSSPSTATTAKHQSGMVACSVECDSVSRQSGDWRCEALVEFCLLTAAGTNGGTKTVTKSHTIMHRFTFCESSNRVEYKQPMDKILKGPCDDDGRIRIQIHVDVVKIEGLRQLPSFDFSAPTNISDTVILAGSRRFHVNKEFLSIYSSVLGDAIAFYSEQQCGEVLLADVSETEFEHLLQAIYPSRLRINVDNVGALLKMADRFKVECVTHEAEQFLQVCLSTNVLERCQLLEWSTKYQLHNIQHQIVNGIHSSADLERLATESSYTALSAETKACLLERLREVSVRPASFLDQVFRRSGRRRRPDISTPAKDYKDKENMAASPEPLPLDAKSPPTSKTGPSGDHGDKTSRRTPKKPLRANNADCLDPIVV